MLNHYRSACNFVLLIFKWPLAVFSLLLAPGVLIAIYDVVLAAAADDTLALWPLFTGAGVYLGSQLFFIRSRNHLVSTLDHELTHSFFAVITGHPVAAIQSSESGHGQMRFRGKGNWLIAISPYALRALPLFAVLLSALASPERQAWIQILAGAALAYLLVSLAREIHPRQTDFAVAGRIFSVLFLPGAIAFVCGLLLTLGLGSERMIQYAGSSWRNTWELAERLQTALTPWLA